MSTRGSIAYGFENGCMVHIFQEMSDDSLRIEVEVGGETFNVKLDAEALAWLSDAVDAIRAIQPQEPSEAEGEGEGERLRGVVVESDKDLVANAARGIARDHNMPLKSAEWMMLEALRVVRSNDNRERDAALARAEAAERERDMWKSKAELRGVEYNAALARATAAEAREAGLREAVRKYVAWSNGEGGDGDTLFDAMRVSVELLQAIAAAPAKEVK
jgi:hypothetical protein